MRKALLVKTKEHRKGKEEGREVAAGAEVSIFVGKLSLYLEKTYAKMETKIKWSGLYGDV